jgi:hypothetical protein
VRFVKPAKRCQHDAFKERGVWCALARVELVVEAPLVDVMSDVDQRVSVRVGEEPADAEVAGVS